MAPIGPRCRSAACDAGRGFMLAVHEAGLLDCQIDRRGWYVSGRLCCVSIRRGPQTVNRGL